MFISYRCVIMHVEMLGDIVKNKSNDVYQL